MLYSWRTEHCPECNVMYNWHIEKLYRLIKIKTGLGPPLVQCSSCGAHFKTDLQEWYQFSIGQKIRYGILSFILSLIVGFPLALASLEIYGRAVQINDRFFPDSSLLFFITILCALPMMILQMVRIELSITRSESNNSSPMSISFWNWQINLQFYAALLCFITLVIFIVLALFI